LFVNEHYIIYQLKHVVTESKK